MGESFIIFVPTIFYHTLETTFAIVAYRRWETVIGE